MKKKNRTPPPDLPKGWTPEKVQHVIDYYDHQSEEDAIAEIEVADDADETFMVVPWDLVPRVQKLIDQHKTTPPRKSKPRRSPPRSKSRHAA
ncbi:MAG: hypothetical protein FWD53_03810 [Phycisphaerales bacterium]|nr:hypothetical protein [Phycisphaerales bacterium]